MYKIILQYIHRPAVKFRHGLYLVRSNYNNCNIARLYVQASIATFTLLRFLGRIWGLLNVNYKYVGTISVAINPIFLKKY